jgi:hypothetical protein
MIKIVLLLLLCSLQMVSCYAGTEKKSVLLGEPKNRVEKSKKKIVLFDEKNNNELLLIDIKSLLEENPFITDNDRIYLYSVINNPQYEFCPETGNFHRIGALPPISSNSNYDLHKAVENGQFELAKFILKFCNPDVNSTIGDKTALIRAIDKPNPKIVGLLLAYNGTVVDENHLKFAKEKLNDFHQQCIWLREMRLFFIPLNFPYSMDPEEWIMINKNYLENIQKAQEVRTMLNNHLGLCKEQLSIFGTKHLCITD